MLFDRSSPPPFYQAQLSDSKRMALDKLFIGTRSQAHYLKRFASFDRAKKIGMRWHWAAFFMTLPWMLYRGRYLDGLVYAVAGWSFLHLIIALVLVIVETTVVPFLPTEWVWPIRLAVGGGLYVSWCVLTAGWADAYYYRVARREISETIEDGLSPSQQAEHLQHEGGTHWAGLLLAFGLFGFALSTIYSVYLPAYATYQKRLKLMAVYDLTSQARQRVEVIYSSTGHCPTGTPLSTAAQNQTIARLQVLDQAAGIPRESQCIVQATLQGARWPIHHLNGQRLSLYRLADGRWRCVTSMGEREAPRGCELD
ncbi:MAG: DUF2628 domain-containing protein [Pseudomonadota bacterium]|nr:DUF2628 domain-containing protein [Pseudomonadota bacterium]